MLPKLFHLSNSGNLPDTIRQMYGRRMINSCLDVNKVVKYTFNEDLLYAILNTCHLLMISSIINYYFSNYQLITES